MTDFHTPAVLKWDSSERIKVPIDIFRKREKKNFENFKENFS